MRVLTITALLAILVATVLGCSTSSYSMPEQERSRVYAAPFDAVWDAISAALVDVKFQATDRRREDGVVKARSGWKMTDAHGYEVSVLVTRLSPTQTRVEVGAEVGSKLNPADFGGSRARVREFLSALDARMRKR